VYQFTHPQVFSNLYEFHPSAEHKRWHFEEYKQLVDPIDFHSMEKSTMEVNGLHQLFGYLFCFSKYIICVQQKNEIHSGLEQLEGE